MIETTETDLLQSYYCFILYEWKNRIDMVKPGLGRPYYSHIHCSPIMTVSEHIDYICCSGIRV